MVATWLFESGAQAIMGGGFRRAKSFTDRGARRSELPCRRTGFTALPLIRSYRARMSRSSSEAGESG